MRLFIFEHVCGGGMAGQRLVEELAPMAAGMLRTLVEDFAAIGVEVVTTLDKRLRLSFTAAEVVAVDPSDDFDPIFDRVARSCDAALLVAPESHDLSLRWASRLRDLGVASLGCEPEAIALASDKLALAEHLAAAGVPTPPVRLGLDAPAYPAVCKPRRGAGCEATFVCRDPEAIDRLPPRDDWIAQALVFGVAASAAFVAHADHLRPLRAGAQGIGRDEDGRLTYAGGSLPLERALEERAVRMAARALQAVPGLRGFVGVDVVLGDDAAGDRVIEINPRPTVAYSALRALCRTSIAGVILNPEAWPAWHAGRMRYDAAGNVTWEVDA